MSFAWLQDRRQQLVLVLQRSIEQLALHLDDMTATIGVGNPQLPAVVHAVIALLQHGLVDQVRLKLL